jgi:ATP diphosphatase
MRFLHERRVKDIARFSKVTPIARLLRIMAALRDPTRGCPWDREQDFTSIAPYTIEEAYEVADAIAANDMQWLREELGDLLFQVVFHARMAEEQGAFDFDDVATAISDKMQRRHPHVFGDERIDSAEEQTRAWEAHKKAERAARGRDAGHSVLDTVHGGRPALEHAAELQRAAASSGFDWRSAREVLPKLGEELTELEAALEKEGGRDQAVAELGDLLFSCVNLARHLGVEADTALRSTNTKFEKRFRRMEEGIRAQGKTLADVSLEEMDALWEAGKQTDIDR